jgi:hypothetical protein
MRLRLVLLVVLCAMPAAAVASNKLIAAGRTVAVAKSSLTVTPDREWNSIFSPPGPNEVWTIDGDELNELMFFGGIASGRLLDGDKLKKRGRPRPLFNATMLITDVPALLENTYRAVGGITVMAIDRIEPTIFAGHRGIRFTYGFTNPDEVQRKGEGYAAIVDGRLYMITFEAPAIHFFAAGIAAARAVIASAAFAKKN